MIQLLKTIFNMIWAGFQPDRSIRQFSGFAFACLALSLVFSGLTAWLSFPAYFAMVPNPDPEKVWYICGFVALAMFYATSTIGMHIAEKSMGQEPVIDSRTIGFVFVVFAVIGGFDTYKGYQVGAKVRAEEVFQEQAFEEAGYEKPYQDQIETLTAEIRRLNEDKVMWQGKWTVRERSSRLAGRKSAELSELQAKQVAAIEDQRQLHSKRQANISQRRAEGTRTLEGVALILYVVQIFLAIPLGIFAVKWDLMDGVRDGRNAQANKTPRERGPGILTRMRNWANRPAPSPQPSAQETQRQPVGYPRPPKTGNSDGESQGPQMGIPQARQQGKSPGDFSPGKSPAESSPDPYPKSPLQSPLQSPATGPQDSPREIQTRKIIEMNSAPKFSKRVQPDEYAGIDEKKYKRFVVLAQAVLNEQGRYNITQISNRARMDPKTIRKYLDVAIRKGDLEG